MAATKVNNRAAKGVKKRGQQTVEIEAAIGVKRGQRKRGRRLGEEDGQEQEVDENKVLKMGKKSQRRQ